MVVRRYTVPVGGKKITFVHDTYTTSRGEASVNEKKVCSEVQDAIKYQTFGNIETEKKVLELMKVSKSLLMIKVAVRNIFMRLRLHDFLAMN